MSVHPYRYRHNRQAGTLFIHEGDEPSRFRSDDRDYQPWSLDDVVDLDTAQAALLAHADALIGDWHKACQSAVDLPDPETGRQTLRECLEVMKMAIDDEGGTDLGYGPSPCSGTRRLAEL